MSDRAQKTEAPTPKRKREARKKGQVARAPELVMWLQIFAASMLVKPAVASLRDAFGRTATRVSFLIEQPDPRAALHLLGSACSTTLVALLPLVGAMVGIAVFGNVAQTGLILSGHKLKPSVERLNPLKGLKRMVSKDHLADGAKMTVRLSALVGAAWPPVDRLGMRLAAQRPTLARLASESGLAIVGLARNVALVGLAFASVDFGLQKRRILRQIRMSKQEIKDEHRSSEGDPLVRSQRRSRQMAMSRNRMMADVAGATAVIVNPTHVAVAIAYRRHSGAPRVVAKGKGDVALRIRAEAEKHGVPIVRDIPLARALHGACALGQEIPADFYEAVARVLAFVMSVGTRASWAGPLTLS